MQVLRKANRLALVNDEYPFRVERYMSSLCTIGESDQKTILTTFGTQSDTESVTFRAYSTAHFTKTTKTIAEMRVNATN